LTPWHVFQYKVFLFAPAPREVREVMEDSPRISVVAVSRNDDHGVNLHRRMQTFVNAFISQCKRHGLHAELILVDWNPPADRPKLTHSLHWPADPRPCEVRVIEVPPHLHQRYECGHALPLFQMIGKNVGIRRARGEYVLCTNIDILFNDELMRFLTHGPLRPGEMYRIDRTDVGADVPVDAPIEQQLTYCEANLLRLNAILNTCRLGRLEDGTRVIALDKEDIAVPGTGIHLAEDWYEPEKDRQGRMFRWTIDGAAVLLQPPPGPPRRLLLEVMPGPGTHYGSFGLEVRDESDRTVAAGRVPSRRSLIKLDLPLDPKRRKLFRLYTHGGGQLLPIDNRVLNFAGCRLAWDEPGTGSRSRPFEAARLSRDGREATPGGVWQQGRFVLQDLKASALRLLRRLRQRRGRFLPDRIHTNTCGDFTMLKREHWFELRAYAEFAMYSLHIDSLLCYAAHYSGIKEVVLRKPMYLYHIEHSAGSGWTPEGEQKLFDRLASKGIPCMTLDELYDWGEKMHRAGHGRLFNDDNWGLADEDLPETWMGAALPEQRAA